MLYFSPSWSCFLSLGESHCIAHFPFSPTTFCLSLRLYRCLSASIFLSYSVSLSLPYSCALPSHPLIFAHIFPVFFLSSESFQTARRQEEEEKKEPRASERLTFQQARRNTTRPKKKEEKELPGRRTAMAMPCSFFQKGHCHFGSRCRNLHTAPVSAILSRPF